jgi:hypothetical protein
MAQSSPTEEFLITDPEAQPGVVLEVEAGVRPVQLLEPYYANHDVRCAFCAHRQVHKKGYLALLPDGRRALCGNVCAEEYFDKQTVNSLDRKRDQLASARLRREQADAIIGNAAALLPIIDADIAPNEWEAEAAMAELGLHLNAAVREQIRNSDVLGVEYLGQACRAFGDARGGIALIVSKASGVTEAEAAKLMEKRAKVVERIEHGTRYLHEAAAFFRPDNLHRFRDWLLANQGIHDIRSVNLSNKRKVILRRQVGRNWDDTPIFATYEVAVPEIEAPDLDQIMATLGW